MTPAEFKAWFDGFTEGMDGPPSAKQWKKITDKVKTIDGTSVLTPVYVDRWWPLVSPATTGWPPYRAWYGAGCGSAIYGGASTTSGSGGPITTSTVRMSAADFKAHQITPPASVLLMAEGRADALAAA